MMSLLPLALLFVLLICLAGTRWPAPKLFVCASLICLAAGWVSTEEVLEAASNQGVITLLLLMLVTVAIDKTQLIRKLARWLISESYVASYWRLVPFTAFFSAFFNNTAVVASLASVVKSNPHHLPSRLLMPLSYAAILGGTITLVGASTNLIVNSFVIAQGAPQIGFFDFACVGLGVFAACSVLLFLLSGFIPSIPNQDRVGKRFLVEAKVEENAWLIGKSISQAGLRNLDSLFLVEIYRDGHLIAPVAPGEVLASGDRLIFAGDIADIRQIENFDGLSLFASSNGYLNRNLVEVVVSGSSSLCGRTIKQSGFRALFNAAVVGVRRDGEAISGKLGNLVLRAGDNLMLAVGPDFCERRNIRRNFFVISDQQLPHKLSLWQEWLSIIGFASAVALAALGFLSLMESLLYLLVLLVLTKTVTGGELRRKFPFDLWLVICSALILAKALTNTGAFEHVLSMLNGWISPDSAFMAFACVFFLTIVITELVTNNAAAALVFPLAYSLSVQLEVSHWPFVMAVIFGASGSFVSPYGYQTNLMVFNTGGYKVSHFAKVGGGISLLYACVCLILIPAFFPF